MAGCGESIFPLWGCAFMEGEQLQGTVGLQEGKSNCKAAILPREEECGLSEER